MKRAVDALWLVLLIAFVFAIPPTFHGDESMYLSMSRDYATVFIDGDPAALRVEPPYYIDSDQQLRLLNGSVQRYTAGFLWHLAGATVDDLPVRPGWDWGLDYDTNLATGHVPTPTVLAAGRLASSVFFALSIVAIFMLAWQFGKYGNNRLTAYVVSALYAVNPLILLNSRRAMQEGSMLLFGLLVMLVAARISKRRSERQPTPLYLWAALVIASALALASKHSAIVFVGGAFGWIFFAELLRWRRRDLLVTAGKLVVCGILSFALVVALSPALWSDPLARFADLLRERAFTLDTQVTADPLAPTTISQHIQQIITEPFIMPVQHFEVAGWATYPPIMDDVVRYMASPFSGVQFGIVGGSAVMLLAGLGALLSFRRSWQAGVLIWLGISVASVLVNPLPWQRYFVPLVPIFALLAGIGLDWIVRRFLPNPAVMPVPGSTPASPAGQAG